MIINNGTLWYLRNELKVIDSREVGWLVKEPFVLIGFTRQDEMYDFSHGLFLRGI